MTRTNPWVFLMMAAASAATVGRAATTDDAGAADNSGVALEEITVTAQRRSENLQNVPISVNAFTSQQLENNGVSNLQDLAVTVPGLSYSNIQGHHGRSHPGIQGEGAGGVWQL